MTFLQLMRSDLRRAQPQYCLPEDEVLYRLHANELPWSITTVNGVLLNQYPSRCELGTLQATLANLYQVSAKQLLLVPGSDEGINLLMRFFLQAGADSMMHCPPTFPMYEFYAKLQGADVISVPLSVQDFSLSIKQISSKWQPNCKLIMLCRPNNPTGNLLNLKTIATLCQQFLSQAMIVVDEAYIEFAGAESAISLLEQFDNLIILRTLSKAHGLAGLRLGVVISREEFIDSLAQIQSPYPISSVVVNIAQRALADRSGCEAVILRIVKNRQLLATNLAKSKWVGQVYPSFANFLYIKTAHASLLEKRLRMVGIRVRYWENYLRITVGREEENSLVMQCFEC